MTTNYFKGIQKETSICKIFQNYIEEKRPNIKTYLSLRKDKQAPIDFIGRIYDKETSKTITELAVEVRSITSSQEDIKKGLGYVMFPISKTNEFMQFRRMGKDCYIVYLLKNKVFFISWDYYIKHNFEIGTNTKGNFIKLPIQSFIYCGNYKE